MEPHDDCLHKHSQLLELNYCPRCGAALEDRMAAGKMRRVCPSCGLIVFRDHKVAAGMLLTDERGRVLLVRRAWNPQQGRWALPAGFVDFDEDPAETAIREVAEETGLQVEVTGLLDVVSGREHPRGANLVLVYRGRVVGGTLAPADDAAEVAFFDPQQLPPLAFRATKHALAVWQAQEAHS